MAHLYRGVRQGSVLRARRVLRYDIEVALFDENVFSERRCFLTKIR